MKGSQNKGRERPHRKLDVWKRSMRFVKKIYDLTRTFPKYELYGISSQMQRCAVSLPSNIAEGAARRTKAEFLQFLSIAQGSLSELDTQLELSYMLGYIKLNKRDEVLAEITSVFMMLSGLIRSVSRES